MPKGPEQFRMELENPEDEDSRNEDREKEEKKKKEWQGEVSAKFREIIGEDKMEEGPRRSDGWR